jgi:hypothetical protein
MLAFATDPPRAASRFAAVGCVGFLAWFRARARTQSRRFGMFERVAGMETSLQLLLL